MNDPTAKDKCPHCGQRDCIADKVYINVEHYGNNGGHFPCVHCGKMIHAILHRAVIVDEVRVSERFKDESDW